MNLNRSNQNPSVAARALSAVSCQLSANLPLSANLAPTEQEVALLTTQYRKAVNGLYEAYRFGQMLLRVRERLEALTQRTADSGQRTGAFRDGSADGLESDPHGSPENQGSPCGAARGTARRIVGNNGNEMVCAGGWNAGTGLKGWLGVYCPEINYSTARRFLSVAEKTNLALAAQGELTHGEGEGLTAQTGETHRAPALSAVGYPLSANAAEPSEQAVRDFLEGKSQRQVLKAPSKPTVRHAMSEEERAEKLAEVCKGFLQSLEGVERTGESDLLRLEDRREIVTRLKALARRLEEAGR